jgi:hypothetical protein
MDWTKEFLDMTYPDQYYKDVIEPAKTGKGPVPSKAQMLSKSQPFKAVFDVGMNPGKYGAFRSAPTAAVKTAFNVGKNILGGPIGWGVTAGLTGAQIGDWAYKNWEPATKFGDWAGGGIYDLIYGPQNKFRQDQFMNTQKQTIQEVIRQAEIEQKRKEEAAAAASAAAQVRANIQRYGSGDRPNTGINTPGTGKGQSPTGGDVQGTPFAQGGLINLYRYGGFI